MDDSELGTVGSSLGEFLDADGISMEADLLAIKRVLSAALAKELEEQNMGKAEFARRMGGTRQQVYKLLDPDHHGVTLITMTKAARALGRKLVLDIQ